MHSVLRVCKRGAVFMMMFSRMLEYFLIEVSVKVTHLSKMMCIWVTHFKSVLFTVSQCKLCIQGADLATNEPPFLNQL